MELLCTDHSTYIYLIISDKIVTECRIKISYTHVVFSVDVTVGLQEEGHDGRLTLGGHVDRTAVVLKDNIVLVNNMQIIYLYST